MGGDVSGAFAQSSVLAQRKPRLGFLGVGWIGSHRMQAVAESGVGEVAVISDTQPDAAERAAAIAPRAAFVPTLETMLEQDLDGVVIATPSALHADQAKAVLERGMAVFCQKPLGRSAAETASVVAAARAANRLLGVDLSYRCTQGMSQIRDLVAAGELGTIHAVDLVFHNAYGPDKPWFYQRGLSGGGCVIDLGTHLIDLALWVLGHPEVQVVRSRLFAHGVPMTAGSEAIEDYALAELTLATGTVVRIACSWKAHAGCDCTIEAVFHGANGGAALRNVAGSFYDFRAELMTGTTRRVLCEPPDGWGGRALMRWTRQLARDRRFDPSAEQFSALASVIDRIYAQELGG
jgi:predicted dehydrogenase